MIISDILLQRPYVYFSISIPFFSNCLSTYWTVILPLNLPCEPCFLLFIFRPSFEYEIHSEGCADPGKAPNTCGISTIKVNGVNYSEQKRGINLVAIDGKTGTSFFILMYEIIDIYNISSF